MSAGRYLASRLPDRRVMESYDQFYESLQLLRKHESKVDWDDHARFYNQVKALAETDPEIAEWLVANPEVLE